MNKTNFKLTQLIGKNPNLTNPILSSTQPENILGDNLPSRPSDKDIPTKKKGQP